MGVVGLFFRRHRHLRPVFGVIISVDEGKHSLVHVPPYFVPPDTSTKSNSTVLPSGDNLPAIRGRFFPESQYA